ncbi:MAG TPA: YciI family protein [Labilithrix sp.]|nr:YciI family protein [Labilithrix sp.]
MKFMVLMIPGNKKAYEQGAMPEPALIEKMMKFNEDLVKAGVLLAGDGLHPSAKGARIDFTGGKASVTDGPFTEARELIGGYWLWQVKSKEEAIAWAKRCPAESGDQLELRQVFDAADFGPEVAAREGALMEEIAKRTAKDQGTSS